MDAPAHYFHWGFVLISVPNLVVIVTMLVVFALALVVPFPRHVDTEGGEHDER